MQLNNVVAQGQRNTESLPGRQQRPNLMEGVTINFFQHKVMPSFFVHNQAADTRHRNGGVLMDKLEREIFWRRAWVVVVGVSDEFNDGITTENSNTAPIFTAHHIYGVWVRFRLLKTAYYVLIAPRITYGWLKEPQKPQHLGVNPYSNTLSEIEWSPK